MPHLLTLRAGLRLFGGPIFFQENDFGMLGEEASGLLCLANSNVFLHVFRTQGEPQGVVQSVARWIFLALLGGADLLAGKRLKEAQVEVENSL